MMKKMMIFLFIFFLLPMVVYSKSYRKSNCDIGIQIYTRLILGIKIFYGKRHAVFLGIKRSLTQPKGERYNWSQERAENFYNSHKVYPIVKTKNGEI
jgi:hypothetical protein